MRTRQSPQKACISICKCNACDFARVTATRTPRATPSATTAVAGARTDMHLAVFNLQHTQHILHIAFRWSVNKTPRTFRIIFVRTNTNEKKYDNGEEP